MRELRSEMNRVNRGTREVNGAFVFSSERHERWIGKLSRVPPSFPLSSRLNFPPWPSHTVSWFFSRWPGEEIKGQVKSGNEGPFLLSFLRSFPSPIIAGFYPHRPHFVHSYKASMGEWEKKQDNEIEMKVCNLVNLVSWSLLLAV